jgi:hypothetical protein
MVVKKTSMCRNSFKSILHDQSGLALVEFAVSLPFFMGLAVGGIEMANYASVIMQLNQITLHTADNAARMGQGSALAAKQISEADVVDVFEGTLQEGDRIALAGEHSYTDPVTGIASIRGNTRIILSSIEQNNSFNSNNPKYRIRWQRCAGTATQYTSSYGNTGTSPFSSIGPTGRKVAPPPDGALMFVELKYYYRPKIITGFSKMTDRTISQIASMVVRDKRDFTGPSGGDGLYPSAGVTPATCS